MFDCILGTCYICTSNTYHIQFTSAVVLIVNVLACKSIHCDRLIFSMFSQFAGFSAESLSSRILDAKCDILVTAGKVVLWTDLFSLPCLQSDWFYFCLQMLKQSAALFRLNFAIGIKPASHPDPEVILVVVTTLYLGMIITVMANPLKTTMSTAMLAFFQIRFLSGVFLLFYCSVSCWRTIFPALRLQSRRQPSHVLKRLWSVIVLASKRRRSVGNPCKARSLEGSYRPPCVPAHPSGGVAARV